MSVREDKVQVNVEINGQKAGSTIKELETSAKQLRRELKQLPTDTDEFTAKAAELRNVNTQLKAISDSVKGVDKDLKQTTESSGAFGNALSKIGAVFTAGGLLSIAQGALSSVKGFFSDAIDEANEAELATSRFKGTLENLGKADVFDKFIDLANDLADKIKYLDNDDITGVLEKLALYGKLTENQVKELLPVIIDFAAKQRISLGEAAESIIGALEGQGKSLKQYGINIKDAKTETERFDTIITNLKPKVDGAAEAFGTTLAGKTAIAEQSIKNLKEEIGTGIQPVIEKFYQVVAQNVGMISGIFSKLKENFTGAFGAIFQSEDLTFFGKLKALTGDAASVAIANAEKVRKSTQDIKQALKTPPVDTGDQLFGSSELKQKKTEEQLAKEQQLRDQAKKKAEKDAQDQKARQQKLNEDLLALQQDLAKSMVDAQQDGVKKEIALENLRFQAELININKREQVLIKEGADKTKVAAQINQLIDAQEDIHLDKVMEIQLKYHDKKKEAEKKTNEQLKKEKDEYYKNEVDSVNQYYDTLINAIRENEARKAAAAGTPEEIEAIKQNAADAEITLELQKNLDLQKINQENGKSTIEQENAIADARLKAAEKHADGKRMLEDQVKGVVQDGLDFAIEALGQDEAARKKNAGIIKAFSVARVFINLQEEISGIFTNANRNALNSIVPGAGNVLGAIQAALAVGRATFAVSKINQTQFYEGGRTGKGMGFADSSGHQVAGVVHANEWVAPQWMNDHPAYGKVIHQLEYIRQRGFADGGFTTTPTGGLPTFTSTISESTMQRFTAVLEAFPREVIAKIVFSEFENVRDDVDDVRRNSTIG